MVFSNEENTFKLMYKGGVTVRFLEKVYEYIEIKKYQLVDVETVNKTSPIMS